jgi:hypothetical protein
VVLEATVTDVIVVAAIVAFFGACALLVRALDRMIEGSRSAADAEPGQDAELEPGGLA